MAEDRDRLRVALVFIFVLAAVAAYYFNRANHLDVICQKLLSLDISYSTPEFIKELNKVRSPRG
jgi:hypothetical protein